MKAWCSKPDWYHLLLTVREDSELQLQPHLTEVAFQTSDELALGGPTWTCSWTGLCSFDPQNPAQNRFFELAGLLGVDAKKNEKYNRGTPKVIPSKISLENEGRTQNPKTAKIDPQVYENF